MRVNIKKCKCIITVFSYLYMCIVLAAPSAVSAQSLDVDPPIIEVELVNEGTRGDTQVFSATVTDNDQIALVTLYYRFNQNDIYSSVPMSVIQGTDIFTASVDTVGSDTSVIQYYFEAKDGGENRTVQGFAFDPLERFLNEPERISAQEQNIDAAATGAVAGTGLSTNRKILYGVLGVLTLGILASASSSGSSGSGNSGGSDVDVQILVDTFQ